MSRSLAGPISSLLLAFGIQPRPWMSVVLIAVALAVLVPLALRSQAGREARKAVVGLEGVASPGRAEAEARLLAAMRAPGLVAAAEEALRRGNARLASRAVDRLAAEGGDAATVKRLRRKLELLGPLDPVVEREAIQALVDAGRTVTAWKRLDAALRKFPDDEELTRLRGRLG